MAEAITIRNIRKTYGAVVALEDANLSVGAGEFVSLLGPSGSGKTTLLMIIAGFVQPDRGSVHIGEREVIATPPHKRDIGMVFQNYALFPHMSVAQNIAFPLRYRKISKAEAQGKVASALGLVRLDGYGERRVADLSGGQKQRVALARALVFNPRILLMDEPLSALDKKLREEMQLELRALQRQLGTTTISVTHDQREALTMSDRIAVMGDGAIRQIGTPAEVYERPNSFFVADFVGDAHFLEVEMDEGGIARLGEARFRLDQPPALRRGEPAYLMLRPEKIELLTEAPASEELNLLRGELRQSVYQGDNVTLSLRLVSGEDITVRRANRAGSMRGLPAPGQPVWLGIHPSDTVVVGGKSSKS